MRGWHLRARVGRGAPWLVALMILSLIAELAMAFIHVGMTASYLESDFAPSVNLAWPTAGVIGIGVLWAAVMVLTVVATLGRDRTVVIASGLGLAAAAGIFVLAFATVGALGDAPLEEGAAPYASLVLVVPVMALQFVLPAMALGFVVALALGYGGVSRAKSESQRYAYSAIPVGGAALGEPTRDVFYPEDH